MNRVILATYGGPKCIQPLSQAQDTLRWLVTRRVMQAAGRPPCQLPLEWSPLLKSCVKVRPVQYIALRMHRSQVEWLLTWSACSRVFRVSWKNQMRTGLPSLLVLGCGWGQGWSSELWLMQFEPLWPSRRHPASRRPIPSTTRTPHTASYTRFHLIMAAETSKYQADDILLFSCRRSEELEHTPAGSHKRDPITSFSEIFYCRKPRGPTRLVPSHHINVTARVFKFG